MKILFIALAAGGLILFYLEERSNANQASIAALPISTSNADQLLMTNLAPVIAAGQVVNTASTKPYAEADPTLPGGILVYAGT